MSLFAAYASTAEANSPPSEAPKRDTLNWLENESFKIDVAPTPVTTQAKPETRKRKKKHTSKHKKHKVAKLDEKPSPDDQFNGFQIDKTRSKELLTVKTIARPSAPKYKATMFLTRLKKNNKRKFKRYYQAITRLEDAEKAAAKNEPVITKKNVNTLPGSSKDEHFTGFQQEEDLSQTTAEFNRKLGDNPRDINTWLEYVAFQDTVYQFEKSYRKGSVAKGLRVLAERKLSILDKALTHNPNCEELLRERLNVAVGIYPSDELQIQLRNLVDKDQGNIILWQGYIESIQCSMSHCNTPAVTDLYTKCLSVLHKLRRNSAMEKSQLEENILRMLYQCGLFLKQAGCFEQLWTLLRLYLELNLSPSNKHKFNITSGFNDKELVELEEVVFNSQLPLHELWLRTEKLRESCHWLPFTDEEGKCEDPQRLVFPEDVNELIHPITMPENTFILISTILTLLKVPLLPCRHSTMQDLGLDYVPWALDSIESLLPIFHPLYPINLDNQHLMIDSKLAVGPQYLKALPAQEHYLNFVLTTMKNICDCLTGKDKTAITVRWLNFQRLLIILDKQGRFKCPPGFTKKLKSNLKSLLKEPENRNNVIYFSEYAQIEFELGNPENCLNILQTALTFSEEKPEERCYIFRTLVETYLRLKQPEKSLKYLVGLALDKPGAVPEITEENCLEAKLKFKTTILQIFQGEVGKVTATEHFLPNFLTNWVICNGWFLYFTKGAIETGKFLENIIAELDEKSENLQWQKEVIFEFYVAILFKYCVENPGCGVYKIFDDVITRAIQIFPNNLFLLAVLAKEQSISSSVSVPWWKLKSLLMKTGRSFPILFLVLIANQQINESQHLLTETVSGKPFEVSGNHKNRMLAIFRRITRPDMCTRRCGLVWRLYLQFIYAHFGSEICRNVYFCAVAECPWLKALYIDAAIYIPGELAQIQDLIIEKQLRLHVTPEELDILRN